MKSKLLNHIVVLFYCLIVSPFILTSCIEDIDESIVEPTRYQSKDIQSYADLFDTFWTIMNQKYNYLNEHKGTSWENIHKEYYPKFKELRTYNKDASFTKSEIYKDHEKAVEYFNEIVEPILDKHFNVKIKFPVSHSYSRTYTFSGGRKARKENPVYNYGTGTKYWYMKRRMEKENGVFNDKEKDLIGGRLQDNSDIYYFSFKSFMLSKNYIIKFRDNYNYLDIDKNSSLYLNEEKIKKAKTLDAIKDPAVRKILIDKSIECLELFNSFINSELSKKSLKGIKDFISTEELSDDILNTWREAYKKAPKLKKEYDKLSKTPEFSKNSKYRDWFKKSLAEHLQFVCEYDIFLEDINKVITNDTKIALYKNFFNPLKKGEINKLIIDLRSNGGGSVIDARIFTDRFITKDVVFAYQRFKEDNNPYGYTPWAPAMTHKTDISINRKIPIVVLINKGSASMSEISTLMLRSQGEHVKVVGHYSSGATAGLGDPDSFNGGLREKIANVMEFYMPLMATQDANKNIIESIGIKPDYLLTPLTKEEAEDMKISRDDHVDRALEKAIEVLQSK